MNNKNRIAVLFVGLVLTLGSAASWGQLPASNDISDSYAGNTGGGTGALHSNTTGLANTAYGYGALRNNNASYNTAIGNFALEGSTTGSKNTATGSWALEQNNGSYNTANGVGALTNNQGDLQTAVGYYALINNNSGYNNTALGAYALYNNTGGNTNLALGSGAGYYATGSKNIYLAHYGVAGESNTMRLGQGQTHTFIAGIAGVSVTGSQVLINSKGQLGVLQSSARYKRDIQDMGERTEGLLKLRPVTFRYKEDPEAALQYGLIAEEVAKVYPELVVRGPKGEVESVQYHQIISMLLNEVQHQQKQIEELKAQNEEQRSHNASLETRLERLETQAARTGVLATSYERSF